MVKDSVPFTPLIEARQLLETSQLHLNAGAKLSVLFSNVISSSLENPLELT
jgi:hypothetical protein